SVMNDYARFCPRCRTRRPLTEILCAGTFEGRRCNWSLLDVLPTTEEAAVPAPPPPVAKPPPTPAAHRRCRNGHDLAPGDFLCVLCGEGVAATAPGPQPPPAAAPRSVDGWELGTALPVTSGEADLFFTRRAGGPERAVFKHYRRGIDPETSLYA